jgi:hypothetical protein
MSENEMGYRGSKSKSFSQTDFVKEQRVDGSWSIKAKSKLMLLRCTLMGFERNTQVKILTNRLNNRMFSTYSSHKEINPWFITGFSDAEASFIVSISLNAKTKTGWRVTPNFSIHIHKKDVALLQNIRDTLGVGKVRKNSCSTVLFRVDNLQELQVIVDHFTKYPLIGSKVSDFLLFKDCYEIIKQKQHLTPEGLAKIVALKSSLNKGLNDSILKAFPSSIAIPRPVSNFQGIPSPYWISGFVAGDSSFCVSIEKTKETRIGHRIRLIFGTCLHIRDRELLVGMANYLKIAEGKHIYNSVTRKTSLLQIKNISDILNKIIPFFN